MIRLTDLFRWLFAGAFLRLYFGGKSSSSQQSTTQNISTTNVTDRRSVADGEGIVVGDFGRANVSKTFNFSTTDQGAVAAGRDLGAFGVQKGADVALYGVQRGADLGLSGLQRGADLAQAALVGITKLATENQAAGGKLAAAALSSTESALGKLEGAYSKANEQAQAVASGNKSLAIVGMVVAAVLGFQLLKSRRAA